MQYRLEVLIFLFGVGAHSDDLGNFAAGGGACQAANAGLPQVLAHSVADFGHGIDDFIGGDVADDPGQRHVGGGDAFASGLIYAMMHDYKPMDMVNFAVASSAIKHTIHGDANITDDVESIRNLMNMNYDIKR